MYKAAIFDMDGTILNTLGDLTDAINYAMKETGHKYGYNEKIVAHFFGSGVYVALKRALSVENIEYSDIFATNQALYRAIRGNGQQIPLDFIPASG